MPLGPQENGFILIVGVLSLCVLLLVVAPLIVFVQNGLRSTSVAESKPAHANSIVMITTHLHRSKSRRKQA